MPEVRDLAARLREATAERHAAVESLPFFLALRAEELPVQSAVSYLRGLAIVHAVLESCLSGRSGLSRELWRPGMERLPELLATFEAADVAGLPDVPRAIDAALRLGDRILLAAHEPVRLLGPLYVLEGSQLGGQVLRRHLAAALGLAPSRVAYGGEGAAVQARWRSFEGALDSLRLETAEVEGILAAAQATFDGISELAQAAFPYEESELRHRVTALNPEAGRHAMPQSEVEIARALRCAEVAWRRFPYLEMRFGERGRRFTSSDS
jgi:heme oxygenase